MVERSLGKHIFVFYDSIEDLPISQFHKYSKFVMVEGGIGDSIQDIDAHISRVINFMGVDLKKARQELLNMRQNIYMVLTEQDLQCKALLCLVKSVDGADWTDFSDSGINRLYDMVLDAKFKDVNDLARQVREAIDQNLVQYFPTIFDDAVAKNYCDLLRKRALLQGDTILNGTDHKEEIESLTNKIFEKQTPKNFEGSESEEIKFDRQFEDMCLTMAKEFGGGVKKYTTMEFYSAYTRLCKEAEEMKKRTNKRK